MIYAATSAAICFAIIAAAAIKEVFIHSATSRRLFRENMDLRKKLLRSEQTAEDLRSHLFPAR